MRRINHILPMFSGLVVLALAGTVAAVISVHHERFYPGVHVAGLDFSGLSREQGAVLLQQKIDTYKAHAVRIVIPDTSKPSVSSPNTYTDVELPTTAGALGLSFNTQTVLDTAWQIGHQNKSLAWIKTVVPTMFSGTTIALAYQIDPIAIQTFVSTQVVPKIGEPIPAHIVVTGDMVSVAPPVAGLQLDQPALAHALASSLQVVGDGDISYLRAQVTQIDSPITQESMRPLAAQFSAIGNSVVKLTASGITLTPKRAEILSWITPVQDDNGTISLVLQKEVIAKYLLTTAGLDQAKSLDAIVQGLGPFMSLGAPTPAVLAVAIVTLPKAPSAVVAKTYTPGKFEGKYIEVNLTDQRLYAIEGNTLAKAYIISSGKQSTPTPIGTFTIHSKSPRAYSAEFGLYMPYWENFYDNGITPGAYGLHELPEWPNGYKEGQSHLGIPVSHGCVRLGIGDAREVYYWTNIGTPVYIHF